VVCVTLLLAAHATGVDLYLPGMPHVEVKAVRYLLGAGLRLAADRP